MDKLKLSVKKFDITPIDTTLRTDDLTFNRHFFEDRIAIRLLSGIHIVQFSEIIRIEADNGYSNIYVQDGKKLMVCKTLSRIELHLQSTFIRVHQSHIINLLHLKYLDRKEGYVLTMSDNSKVTLSTRKRESFMKQLENFIEL